MLLEAARYEQSLLQCDLTAGAVSPLQLNLISLAEEGRPRSLPVGAGGLRHLLRRQFESLEAVG
jgi:hypothetical protein